MRVHRVPCGTMPPLRSVHRPNPCNPDEVQAARIALVSDPRSRRGPPSARSHGGNAFVYTAAQVGGFRYPNQFREPGPGNFWLAKHAKP